MTKGRVEAFSDGVIAIIITIMVLELKTPEHATWAGLCERWPTFVSYVLSSVVVLVLVTVIPSLSTWLPGVMK